MSKNFSENSEWWQRFLAELSNKVKSLKRDQKNLSEVLRNAKPRPQIYFVFGIHGNILFTDVGYCEFDNSENAWNHIQRWAEFLKSENGFPVGFEIGIVSLNELNKKYPVWALLEKNQVEFINPLYSQPYLRQVSEESNIRQFEWGIEELKRHNLSVSVYCSSEHSLHPQIPQLLNKFGIKSACLSTRLAGGAPTSYEPKLIWKGLDNSEVLAITSQSGVSNGQIWHGKFFEELPSLIFGGVARPDLTHLVYVNIEDFANPMPGYQDIASHLKELEKINLHMRGLTQIISDPNVPISRVASWTIDDFPIKLMQSKIIQKMRIVEDKLVNVESSMALIYGILKKNGLLSSESAEIFDEIFISLKNAWHKVLLAQNHDGYVVPFTKPGMYSMQQGLNINVKIHVDETVEEYGLRLLSEAEQNLEKAKNMLNKPTRKAKTYLICNWLWDRDEFIDGKLLHLPSLGSISNGEINPANTNPSPQFSISCSNTSDNLGIKINNHLIQFSKPFQMEVGNRDIFPHLTILKGDGWSAKITDCNSRLEFDFDVDKAFGVDISIKMLSDSKLYITYPFGAEPTQSCFGHSLRFYYNEPNPSSDLANKSNGLVFAHQGIPYFRKTDQEIKIHIDSGNSRFAYARARSIIEAYKRAWEFFYPPLIIPFLDTIDLNRTFTPFSNSIDDYVQTGLFFKDGKVYIRLLSIDGNFLNHNKLDNYNNFHKHSQWIIQELDLI